MRPWPLSNAGRRTTICTRIYARGGVGHLWIVDPVARTLETYRRQDDQLESRGGEASLHAEPFDAAPLDLSRCWTD